LFHRTSRGVSLTPAGKRLLPYATKVAHLLNDARRVTQEDGTPKGTLAVGALETTAALRLSPHLTAYAAANPQVDLVLKTGTS
jgi:DNA-binding transcriptional LysR family regulator